MFRVSAHVSRSLHRHGMFQRAPSRFRRQLNKSSCPSLARRRKRATPFKENHLVCLGVGSRGRRDADVTAVQWVEPGLVGLYREKSEFNGEVKVVENISDPDGKLPECFRDARILLLGPQKSVGTHSVYKESNVFTGSYWDALAVLPGLCPEGPIGIYGLGSGTVARIVNKVYPEQKMLGFEIDPQVLDASRLFMGLQEIEDSGMLECRVCDCLRMSEGSYENAFAGIVVDLYLEDTLIDEIDLIETWEQMKKQLAPGGKILANIGLMKTSVISSIFEVFKGEVLWNRVDANGLTLMSVDPLDPNWENVPKELHEYTKGWRAFDPSLIFG
ncbi:hypothetical protein BSKO_11680 [Bryopsis sp. KO-2023]|nr:hypothetical protein BSKO_11680 [Bryopsis sp. KO-2023]